MTVKATILHRLADVFSIEREPDGRFLFAEDYGAGQVTLTADEVRQLADELRALADG